MEETNNTNSNRRRYDKQFKLDAVRLTLSGRKTSEVARDLGIQENTLHKWRKEFKDHEDDAFPGNGTRPASGRA